MATPLLPHCGDDRESRSSQHPPQNKRALWSSRTAPIRVCDWTGCEDSIAYRGHGPVVAPVDP